MDCVLCTSTHQGRVDPLESPNYNCLSDLGELTGQKFAHSLCQLLDLPSDEFQDKFLQPDISFRTTCTQSLSSIWILLDQLQQLQKQISEVRGLVTSQILSAQQMQNENQDYSFHPVHLLRTEICTRVFKFGEQNSGVECSILYGGIIEDTTVKEEIEETEECDIPGEPDPDRCPIDSDSNGYDADIVVEEDDADAMRSNVSVIPIEIDPLIQEIRDSKLVLRVSLTRLEDVTQRNDGQKGTDTEIKVKLTPKPLSRHRHPKLKSDMANIINLKNSTQTSTLRKSMAEIIEREELFKKKYGNEIVRNSVVEDSSPLIPTKKRQRGHGQATNTQRRSRNGIPHADKPISCTFPECSYKFSTTNGRNKHIRTVHSGFPCTSVRVRRQCPICLKTFKRNSHYDVHMRCHNGEKPYICEVCGKGFRSNELLKSHVTRHTAERNISCPHCPKKCLSKHDLQNHILAHTDERNLMCELCSKSFKRAIELRNHQTRFHANELNLEEFKCKFCSKSFHSFNYLRIHEKSHTGDLKLGCDLCSFRCDRPSRLKYHMKSHGDERNLMCKECGKTYKHKSQMEVHMRSHTKERPFKCPNCPSDFRDKVHLRRHVAVLHSELKPFKCTLCGDGFPLRKYLNRHIEKHRSGKTPTPSHSHCVEESQDQFNVNT